MFPFGSFQLSKPPVYVPPKQSNEPYIKPPYYVRD